MLPTPCFPVSSDFLFLFNLPSSPLTLQRPGQEGAQAIEDGIALRIALSNLPSNDPNAIERRLSLLEKIRINRGTVMQIFSNAGQDDAARVRDEASKFIPADTVPSMSTLALNFLTSLFLHPSLSASYHLSVRVRSHCEN
jgi:hypothetical protein